MSPDDAGARLRLDGQKRTLRFLERAANLSFGALELTSSSGKSNDQAECASLRKSLGLRWTRRNQQTFLPPQHRLLGTLFLFICWNLAAAPLHAADSVAVENTKPGTTAWQLTNPATQGTTNDLNAADYANVEIQGYASLTSVPQGGTIDFHVRTINTNSYTMSVFRMGYYNGAGGRLMLGPITLPGVVQPMPPAPVYQPTGTGIVECNWSTSYSLTVPTDWVSGIYLVKLALSSPAKESYIVFVVRDDTRNAPILFQSSVNTYQAYNEWGGSSLYTTNASGSTKTGVKVSFNRPYWRNFGAGDFMSSFQGAPGYEMQMVRWLEKQGYDLTYATDVDTHENPSTAQNHEVFLIVGHDEYWSRPMRTNVTNALNNGVHLGIFAANVLYWQVRFEPSSTGVPDRTMVSYKELAANDPTTDSSLVTTLWRNLGEPEGALLGVQYNLYSAPTISDIVVTNASHWLFNGTGVSNGTIFPNVEGYETDSLYPPSGATVLAHSPYPLDNPQVYGDMTIYTAPSGANVFATGTIEWSLGLDDFPPSMGVVPAMQQITANFLARALQTRPAPTLTSLNPISGGQGQNLTSVILFGSNFQGGAACNFGAGVTVNSCTFNSPTQLTANISISSSAATGSRSITVTNPDTQSVTLTNGFTVTTAGALPPPAVFSVTPNTGALAQNLTSVVINGNSFQSGATCNFGAGITVNSCVFNSVTQLTANISISSNAGAGSRTVSVTNPDNQTGTLANAFSVTSTAAISVIQRATFSRQPTSGGTVTLTLPQATGAGHTLIVGVNLWPLDVTSVSDGSGDTFTRGLTTSIYHDTNGSATYSNFYYAKSTAGGTNSLTLKFSGGSTYLMVAVAEVAGLDPSTPLDKSGNNESLTATTAWSSATVSTTAPNEYLFSWAVTADGNPFCTNPASGWTMESQINDSDGDTVCIVDRIVSASGSYTSSVTASSAANYVMNIVTLKSGAVAIPAPTLTAVSPNSAAQGQSFVSVNLTGSNFQSGATCSFGAGVTVNSCTFNSATQLTAIVSIAASAAVGARTVTVTNPDTQTGSLNNGFTVATALPAPTVTSASPNTGAQGQNLTSVILAGSHFQSGATCSFGAGITVNSCTFNSATQLTASLSISATAAAGARSVTVTNPDNQTGTVSNGFTVSASAPTVTSATPNSGAQGQNLASVVLAGTGFQSGATCNFGAGITVNSCTFTSATQLTASLSISATAATGARNIVVTNPDTQSGTLTSGFTVGAAAPTVTAATPNSGAQGQNLASVVLAGTGFQSGATCSFGAGITVNSCTFNSATQLTASLSISATAATGARNVVVTNPDTQSGTLTSGFTVGSAAPTLTSATPNSGAQGQNLASVILAGTNFQSGATCSFGAGITVNSCTFTSATQLTANLAISATAAVGNRNVTVTNPDTQNATLTNGFSVTAPAPTVTGATPNTGAQGQTLASVILAGTNFQSGATCNFGAGITVNSCTFNSATQLTANLSIALTATVASRNVVVTNPDTQTVTLTNGFSVTTAAPAPTVTGATPNTGAQGQSLTSVVIAGSNFQSGATCSFGAGITVNSCTFNSATQMTASLSISATAAAGPRNVVVTNPDTQNGTLTSGFSVTAAAPTLTSATPNAGAQGQNLASVVLAGTNFQTGATCDFGAGITVNSCTFNSATQLTASLSISATAATGARNVVVTNPDTQSATLTNGFTVSAAAPTVTSATPNSGAQGQNLASVILAGVNFQSGATCSFGAGITVNSCTFASATQLTANLSISATAATGARNIVINNPDTQSATLTNGFTVSAAAPILTSATPNSGAQGQNLASVILAGSNFQSGATCNFGAGITVNSCTFNSATQLTANLSITLTATVASRNVTVTNPDTQNATLTNGFLVTTAAPAPTVTSATPNAGAQGQNLASMILAGSNFQSGATCSFGAGITVNSCTFNSATQLTASLSISANAAAGPRNVVVTNPDTQSGTLTSGFSVSAPAPTVTSASPNSGAQGQNLSNVILTGTNFQSGATCSFGADITVNSCTFASATQLTASLSISASAAIGSRNVAVTNPDTQSATLTNGFTVSTPAPTVTSATPNSGIQGQNLASVIIAGSNFQSGATCNFGAGITVNSCSFSSATQLTASLSISAGAAAGAHNVVVTNPDTQSGMLTSGFSVIAAAPAVISVTPNGGSQGQNLSNVIIAGSNFQSGATCNFGVGITVNSCTFNSATQLIASLSISASAATGARNVVVTNPDTQSGTLTSGFSVIAPAPSVTSVTPNTGAQGQNLASVIITGSNFQNGATCNFGAGITVNSCAFSNATQMTASLSISATATVAARNVTVTNPDTQSATLNNGFSVTAATLPAPTLSSVSPNTGSQGQNLASVVLTGSNFRSGASCSFGAGITVNSCTFNSATQLTASVSISASAAVGTRNVTVTNTDTQSATLTNGFSVTTAVLAPPTLTSATPNTGAQGQNLTSVILAGSNFQSGATCSFGAGITVNSCTFNSATQLTANLSIAASATVGTRNVTVTNPDTQSSTLNNGFSVTAAAAAISLVQKLTYSKEPTSGGSVTLTLPQATGAGHTLIVGVSFWPLDISSVADGSGDTFTRGLTTSVYHNVSGSATYNNFYYAKSIAGGTTSLTLNFSGGSTYLLVAVAEVAGLSSTAPLDQSAYHDSTTATTAWSSAAVTTTAANEYLFSWAATQGGKPTCSKPATGWTIETQTNDSAGATVCLLDRIVSATGSYTASVTASSSTNYVMNIVTLH
jgi:N,N-dimethylformamidase beta subunit-like protein/quinohemoprotein amine dehydrogenase alpha subunit-like protein